MAFADDKSTGIIVSDLLVDYIGFSKQQFKNSKTVELMEKQWGLY